MTDNYVKTKYSPNVYSKAAIVPEFWDRAGSQLLVTRSKTKNIVF